MPTQSEGQVLRTVPLSQIVVREGFNPSDAERAELERLKDSVREHGVIQPLVVREAEDGYELVDGERRYRACAQAAVTQLPVVVRETDTDTEGLDVALVANMSRVDLDPVEEARAAAADRLGPDAQGGRRAALDPAGARAPEKRLAAQNDGEQTKPVGEPPQPVDEEAQKEERRRERERLDD